jgi:hypothetical protein
MVRLSTPLRVISQWKWVLLTIPDNERAVEKYWKQRRCKYGPSCSHGPPRLYGPSCS